MILRENKTTHFWSVVKRIIILKITSSAMKLGERPNTLMYAPALTVEAMIAISPGSLPNINLI